jgi:RNA polymerase sigma-70 factor (ECF subfamily)
VPWRCLNLALAHHLQRLIDRGLIADRRSAAWSSRRIQPSACDVAGHNFASDPVTHDDQQLFERFRRCGDVAALGELFDRVAPALLRVALHLARDPAGAEDLLQSTFLRAIEVRDEWDGHRPLLPWLCGILQNRARHERWQGGRVPDPARLTVAPPVDPLHAAEQTEFDGAVDAAIVGLPEVYRPVLRLHLVYGHQPAEIAHALERLPSTVRNQLARGLELLRRLLPVGFAGTAAFGVTTGRGLAAVKRVVLGQGVVAGPAVLAGAMIGGTAMMKKVVIVAAVAVLSAGAWVAWPMSETVPATGKKADTGGQPVSASVPHTALPLAVGPMPNERVGVTEPTAPTTGSLRIACRWGDDGAPSWSVLVLVTSQVRDGALLQRSVSTSDNGSVLVTDLPAVSTLVESDRGGSVRLDVVAGATTDVDLMIPAGIEVRGRVVDDQGACVQAARIWLSNGPGDYFNGRFVTDSDQAGRFVLRAVEPKRFLSASARGLRNSLLSTVSGQVGGTTEVELLLRGAGVSLIGRVVDPSGAALANACVFIGRRSDLKYGADEFRPPLELRTASDGTFCAHGLRPGGREEVWVRAIGCCAWFQIVELATSGDTRVAVQLQVGATLSGRATDADGRPVARASVTYQSSTWYPPAETFPVGREPAWSHYGAETNADGRYHIDCITPGTLRLLARKGSMESRSEVPVMSGNAATWDPVLVDLTIHGRVVDERGAPLAGVQVTARPAYGDNFVNDEQTDARGRFVCRTLAQVPYCLRFYLADDHVQARPASTLRDVQPSGDELEVRLPESAMPTAAVIGRLLDNDGRPLAKGQVIWTAEGMRSGPFIEANEAGEFCIRPLPAGIYRLQASVAGGLSRRTAWTDPLLLAAGETRNVGAIQMPETGSILVTATGPDGAPLDQLRIVIVDDNEWSERPRVAGKLDRGRLRIDDMAPGNCRLRVEGLMQNLPDVDVPVSVAAGQTTKATLRVPKGVAVKLVLSPASEPVPMDETFVWKRDGVVVQHFSVPWRGNRERMWPQRMLPGSYEISITSETGRREQNHFVIGVDDPPDRVIAIKLP